MPIMLIRKARMVSPTVLGIDAEIEFFHSDSQEGPRYVELKATINGKSIREKFPVTDLVSPSEIAVLEWPHQDRLKIDLTKWGIAKFTGDQVFTLTGIAFSSSSSPNEESTVEVKIPLPVIIAHGYILREWWGEDSYWLPYYNLQEFLKGNGYDDAESGYKNMWGQPNIRFSPRNATPADIVKQMDSWIDNALGNTYAEKVNVIRVSLGGLVGRYYITEHDVSKVHKLIMVTATNEGSSLFEGEFFINLTSSRSEAQAYLLNSNGEENLANWVIPTYQSLYTPDGKEVPHPFKNVFHENGYDKPAPQGVYYYSIFSAERETPYKLIVEERGNWYKVIGDKERGKGDGNLLAQSCKTFGCNIPVPTKHITRSCSRTLRYNLQFLKFYGANPGNFKMRWVHSDSF